MPSTATTKDVWRQERGNGEKQEENRDRQHQLEEARDDEVHPAAEEASQSAQKHTNNEGDAHRHEANRQRIA